MSRWPGTWLCVCDVCGFEFHSDELSKRWDGLMVCKDDYEQRHPSDYVRVVPEHIVPPWVRPEPPDVFIGFCTLYGRTAFAGIGEAGCMIAGNSFGIVNVQDIGTITESVFLVDDDGNFYTDDEGNFYIL